MTSTATSSGVAWSSSIAASTERQTTSGSSGLDSPGGCGDQLVGVLVDQEHSRSVDLEEIGQPPEQLIQGPGTHIPTRA
jgi:hypothetical protein